MSNEYLQHYGVLGMKWGVRKAQRKGTTYTYKSLRTKVKEKKASRAKDPGKAAKYLNRAKRSAELDNKEQAFAESLSLGKTIAAYALTYPGTIKTYQQRIALGEPKAKAAIKTLLLGRPFIKEDAYIKQDER